MLHEEFEKKSESETNEGCHNECDCVVLVRVTINENKLEIEPGIYRGAEIKKLGQVAPAYELELVRKGETFPIPNDKEIKVKGCEKFIAFPCKGQAS